MHDPWTSGWNGLPQFPGLLLLRGSSPSLGPGRAGLAGPHMYPSWKLGASRAGNFEPINPLNLIWTAVRLRHAPSSIANLYARPRRSSTIADRHGQMPGTNCLGR